MNRAWSIRWLRALLCAALVLTPMAGATLAGCGGGQQQVKKQGGPKKPKRKAAPSPFATARTSLPTCDALVDQAESLISPAFGKRARKALSAAAPAYGDEVARRVLPRLLEHSVTWARSSAGLCMRHVSQAALSKTEYEKRLACHGEAFARLRSVANALDNADAAVVEWIIPTVGELDELLAHCGRGGVWRGYDVDPVGDAGLVQAMADLTILQLLQRKESLPQATARAVKEAEHARSRMLQARVLVASIAGRSQDAGEQGLQQALELFEQAGSAHGEVLGQGAAARFYSELDQPGDALAHVAELFAACDAVHGADSRTCAGERRRMTLLLMRARRPEEELKEWRRALKVLLNAVGDLHPETLVTRLALTSLELHHGSAEKAERQIATVLAAGPRVYGEAHPLVGDQLRVAARVAYKSGKLDRALKLTERALELHRRAHGDVHRRVADDLALLGKIARRRGDVAGAAQAYDRALLIQRRLHPGASPVVSRALKDAANAFVDRGNPPPKALKYLEQARHMDTQLLGDDDTAVAVDLRLLGRYWAARRKWKKAYALHLESVKRLNTLHGPDHPETVRSTRELDAAVRGQGM